MIMVVPPAMPAAVPEKKSSLATVPMKGSSICVCGSMPPGITYCPPASITRALEGASSFWPTALIWPPSTSTSARFISSAVTTVPPRIRIDMAVPPCRDPGKLIAWSGILYPGAGGFQARRPRPDGAPVGLRHGQRVHLRRVKQPYGRVLVAEHGGAALQGDAAIGDDEHLLARQHRVAPAIEQGADLDLE